MAKGKQIVRKIAQRLVKKHRQKLAKTVQMRGSENRFVIDVNVNLNMQK